MRSKLKLIDRSWTVSVKKTLAFIVNHLLEVEVVAVVLAVGEVRQVGQGNCVKALSQTEVHSNNHYTRG